MDEVLPTRVNLGCGNKILSTHQNVDLYSDKADVKADIRFVRFPTQSLDEVLAVHVIEHLSRYDGVKLIQRSFRWLRHGGELIVETPDFSKCRKLLESKDRRKKLMGGKGMVGGRSGDRAFKESWHEWILKNVGVSSCPVIPDKFVIPGEQHFHVWSSVELADEMKAAGFTVEISKPQFHGKRSTRDTRVVGMRE